MTGQGPGHSSLGILGGGKTVGVGDGEIEQRISSSRPAHPENQAQVTMLHLRRIHTQRWLLSAGTAAPVQAHPQLILSCASSTFTAKLAMEGEKTNQKGERSY